uniref:Lipid-binding serum glycoprotein C-terminal domain-containing protein n=1 Tax=Panagrolaimus sp. PS1159 TaxID=55785 RepID=A0AC35FZ44_9BILA
MLSYPQLEFHTTDLVYTTYRSFQAFVYAPNINELSLCPLSTMKTFILDSNLDFIPITSNFNNILKLSPQTCTWNFQIPLKFKLKIHVKSLNLHFPSALTITIDTNKTTVQITSVGIKYLIGSNFTIIFDTKKNIVGSLDFFAAIISAVQINPIIEQSNCFQAVTSSNNDSKTIIFGNYNESLGYENNEV